MVGQILESKRFQFTIEHITEIRDIISLYEESEAQLQKAVFRLAREAITSLRKDFSARERPLVIEDTDGEISWYDPEQFNEEVKGPYFAGYFAGNITLENIFGSTGEQSLSLYLYQDQWGTKKEQVTQANELRELLEQNIRELKKAGIVLDPTGGDDPFQVAGLNLSDAINASTLNDSSVASAKIVAAVKLFTDTLQPILKSKYG